MTPLLPETEPLPEVVATMLPEASMIETLSVKLESEVALFQTSTLGIRAESAEGLPDASHVISPVTLEPPAYTPQGAMTAPGDSIAVKVTLR